MNVMNCSECGGTHFGSTKCPFSAPPPAGNVEPCQVCGKPLTIGQQGCIVRVVEHEPVGVYHPFIPYFDFALGREVTSLAERWRFMRGEIDRESGERRGQLDYRDKMSPGDLSARRDRLEQERKEQAR